MSHISKYRKWKELQEDSSATGTTYTIDNRANYKYKIGPNGTHWKYKKDGTNAWSWVENTGSVNRLNKKYGKSLKVYSKLQFSTKSDESNFNMAKIYIHRNNNNQLDVISAIKKAGKSLGMNDNAIAALIGNVGRENALKWNTISSTHTDPKNSATNFGIISWQGDRRNKLIKKLTSDGNYRNGKIIGSIQSTIQSMLEFIKIEMDKYDRFPNFDSLKNAGSTKAASDALYKYIVYSMGKYNGPDTYFHAWKNHMWAKAAKDLNLISYS